METGRRVAIVGTEADSKVAGAVMNAASGCVDFVGRIGLGDLAALFRHASAVVGNYTGPTFLAARFGTPTLMQMGAYKDLSISARALAGFVWTRSLQ